MSLAQLQRTLADLPRFGTLIKDRGYRQVWRFEQDGKAFYLKFYPRRDGRLKRMLRGSPAMREFLRLQWLQRAKIPSPRAVATLMGMRIAGTRGDAVILEAIEPSVPLQEYLTQQALAGKPPADHLQLAHKLCALVRQLGEAKLGHDDLNLGNFLLHQGQVYLLDAYAVRRGGLRLRDVMMLGHSARRFCTRQDLIRGWRMLQGEAPMPKRNPLSPRLYRKFVQRINDDNEFFARVEGDGWSGACFKRAKFPRRSSAASQMHFTHRDWEQLWPTLLAQVQRDQFNIHKRSASGDVLYGEIVVGGRPINVYIKRPRRKFWYRYFTSVGPFTRVRRVWTKAWKLAVRDIPTEWPLLYMEKRTAGYMTDGLIVFEHVPGTTLAEVDLDALSAGDRETLFHRLGRTLRQIDEHGFAHFDSKANNWIVQQDEKLGPVPVMIDVDGVRHYQARAAGIRRLLRSMRQHPQYTPADSLALCRGYLPFSPISPDDGDDADDLAGESD